jgi:hypothetical protein
MRIIVENTEQQKYLGNDGNWSANLSAARDFRSELRALDAVRQRHEPGLRVMYYFEELHYRIGARSRAHQ